MSAICISFISIIYQQKNPYQTSHAISWFDDVNDAFLDKFLEYPPASHLELNENLAGMISAHDYHSEIPSVEVNVHVDQELLGDSGGAYWVQGSHSSWTDLYRCSSSAQ